MAELLLLPAAAASAPSASVASGGSSSVLMAGSYVHLHDRPVSAGRVQQQPHAGPEASLPSSLTSSSAAALASPPSVDGSPTDEDVHKDCGSAGALKEAQNQEEDAEEEEDAYDSCCICFDGKEFVLTSCCHLFCLPCITRWIEISGTCPICRNEFDAGVELYNLIGTVEDTVRAIKELHKRKRKLEKRRELLFAQRRGMSTSVATWGIFQQVMELLFPAAIDGERMLDVNSLQMDEDDSTQQLAHLNLTRIDLNSLAGLPSHNVALAQRRQLNATPSFPFLSFCCLPQSSTIVLPPFQSLRGRIH